MRARVRHLARLTLLVSALGAVGIVALAALILNTGWGREYTTRRLTDAILAQVREGTRVSLHGLRVSPSGRAHLDSLIVRDPSGRFVAAIRGLQLGMGLRAAFDRELYLERVIIEEVELDLVRNRAGQWNLTTLLSRVDSTVADSSGAGSQPWRIRIDTLSLRRGTLSVTRPDSLPSLPPRRDVLRELGVELGATRYTAAGPRASVTLAELRARATEPDLGLLARDGRFQLDSTVATLRVPTLTVGSSSVALDAHIDWRDSSRDARVVMDLQAREVDLADIAWADSLIPASGRGSARVRIENGRRDGEYRARVDAFVVEASDSRVEGRLVAEFGDTLAIRDLDVTASPLDFAFIREVFGPELPPAPWDGLIRGRLRGPGGPLSSFVLSESALEFTDRRIGGSISRFTIGGTLDLAAEETTFRDFLVRVDSLDVRSAGAISALADSLRGYVTGRVTLNGQVVNVRFGDLDIEHIDGDHPRSRIRGSGRIAQDTMTTWLEASLALDAIALAPLAPAVTEEPLRGVLTGTLDVAVQRDSVALNIALEGEGARVQFVGSTSTDSSRLVALGLLRFDEFDAGRFLPTRDLPAHLLSGSAELGLDGDFEAPSGPVAFWLDTASRVLNLPLRRAYGALQLEPGGLRVDSLLVAMDAGSATAKGRLARDPAVRDTLRFVASIDSVQTLTPLLGDSLAQAWADSISGTLRIHGIALGSLDTVDVRAELRGDSLRLGSYSVAEIDGELSLDGIPNATHGLVTFALANARAGEALVHRMSAEALVREAKWIDASFRLAAQDTLYAQGRADIHYMGDSLDIRLDSLSALTREADWQLAHPTRMFRGPDRLEIDSLLLLSRDGARFALSARIDSAGPISIAANALRVPLAHARFTGYMPPRVDGLVSMEATMRGHLEDPRIELTMRLDSTHVDERAAPEIEMQARYAATQADITVQGQMLDRDAFTLTAELPVDLAFTSRPLGERLLERPMYVRFGASATALAGFEALMPGVRDLSGGFDADVQVTGTFRDPEPRGILLVREAAFTVPALGTGFRELLMDVSFSPDSILIQRARVSGERSENDSASIDGQIYRTPSGWRADVHTVARNLRVIDDPRLAEADLSWALRLRGPVDTLSLGGDVSVPRANLFIGRQRRRALALGDEASEADVASKYAPRLEGVRLRLGNEVRLRSPEANVQLSGEVAATGTLDEPDVRGEIYAARGSFRLDLGLLQRTFQVDSGLVRLNGPLSIPPTMDIHTSYTVRQAEREDVKIGARLTGNVDAPRLELSSGDLGTTASETEIISYLLFGAPSFVLDGQSASAVRLATAALVPSLGGAAERALGARLPFLSELQVVTVAGDTPRDFTLNSFEGLLNSFALTAGTQIGSDSYLRLSGGVCRGDNRAAQSLPAWFGITGEYRPREKLSAELSLTPGSAPCNRIGTFTQIYQLGLDLYRDWRW